MAYLVKVVRFIWEEISKEDFINRDIKVNFNKGIEIQSYCVSAFGE